MAGEEPLTDSKTPAGEGQQEPSRGQKALEPSLWAQAILRLGLASALLGFSL